MSGARGAKVAAAKGALLGPSTGARELEGPERLRFALEAAQVGVWDWNVATGDVHWSRELERIHGMSSACAGAGFHHVLEDVHPEDRRRVLDALAAAIDGEADYRVEFRLVRKDGEHVWVEERGRAFFDEAGEPTWMTGVCQDITERKCAEMALQDSELQLRRQAERLAEHDRRKDEFLAMLAHELRNPLTPIVGAVQLLGRSGEGRGRERALGILSRQVEQLRRLVGDLLDVGRITEGRIHLERRRIDAREVIRLALDAAEPLVADRGHALSTEIPDREVPIFADPVRLGQVVANLLNNAAKYTPGRGRIGLSLRALGDSVEIQIDDDGIGIPEAILPHIFEAFTQEEQGLDRAEGGLGLGLKLARELVHLHGGDVEAKSDGRGQGSTFVVRLPSTPCEDIAMVTRESDSAKGRPLRRVLVVDDSVDLAETLAMVLEESGHEVRLAHTGRGAIAEFDDFAPDIVFLDIGLPEMNGYEVARTLRAQQPDKPVLLLALSGYGEREDRAAAEESGFDDHLLKPVDIHTLEEVIDLYEEKAR